MLCSKYEDFIAFCVSVTKQCINTVMGYLLTYSLRVLQGVQIKLWCDFILIVLLMSITSLDNIVLQMGQI